VPRLPVNCDTVVTVGAFDEPFLAAEDFTVDDFVAALAVTPNTVHITFSLNILRARGCSTQSGKVEVQKLEF